MGKEQAFHPGLGTGLRRDDTRTEVLKSNEGFWIENERRGVIMREERTAWAEHEGKKYIVTAKKPTEMEQLN